MNIFYNHKLNLKFSSAQTLQVIKDYYYLSKFGYKIFLYGNYPSKKDKKEIENFIKNSNILILNKYKFWVKFILSKNKIIITRHYKKLKETLYLKKFFNFINFHEMHEESFFYLFKPKYSKRYFKFLLNKCDGIIFTNYSQVEFYKNEFGYKPKFNHKILPNGVEIEKFKDAKYCNNKVLTYTGQFNKWKNIELIFETLSILPKEFTLRLAGGQSKQDKRYIDKMVEKYDLYSRVDYRGFVNNNKIPKILNSSNILLVPLGDNIQSKYLTSPMKLIEYMSTKIPVLAIDYPSIKSLTKCQGVYLSRNNPQYFTKKISEIIKDPKKNKQIEIMNNIAKKYSYQSRSENFNKFIQSCKEQK